MLIESLGNGTFLHFASPLPLSDETKAALLDKWDGANEDGEVEDLLAAAEAIASPKAYIVPVTIDALGEDYAILGGIRFEGTLLPEQLRPVYDAGQPVYFFTNTCGMELHDWAHACDDILLRGVADDICLAYLGVIAKELRAYAEKHCFSGKHFSAMNPGSLASWNIRGQIPTFKLLGEGAVACGVSLGESMLMTPFKSGSGVYFETEHNFESCMFCDKLDCPNRRANFIMNEEAEG